jgi:hypothetical protein
MIVKNNGCATKEVTRASTVWCKVQFAVKPELQTRDLQKKKNAKAFVALWMLSVGLCVIIEQNMYINNQPQTYQKDFEGRL